MKIKVLLGSITIATVLLSCGRQEQGGFQNATPQLPVIKVEQMSFENFTSYPASIEGKKNIDIRAKINGYISKVYVDEGQWVKKGAPLFKLETRSLSQDAEAAKARMDAAQLEVNKLIPLVENKIVSKIQLETAKAQLAQAKSSYESIQANIAYTLIKSPVDGLVGNINYREGSLISPSTQSGLTSVSQVSEVYAFFSLNEKDYMQLMQKAEGNTLQEKISHLPEVELVLANGDNYSHKGRIETIAGEFDKNTGAIRLRAVFPNPEQLLRSGNSGQINLPSFYVNILAIPAESSFELQGKRHVYTLGEDNSLQTKMVEVKNVIDKYVLIDKGLKKGERILAKGLNKVYPGMQIEPKLTSTKQIVESFQTVFK